MKTQLKIIQPLLPPNILSNVSLKLKQFLSLKTSTDLIWSFFLLMNMIFLNDPSP